VYAHDLTNLHGFGQDDGVLVGIAGFWQEGILDPVFVNEIAVASDGTVYASAMGQLFRIDGATGELVWVANFPLGGAFGTGMAFVPAGVVDADHETLLGVRNDHLYKIDTATGALTSLGPYGGSIGMVTATGDISWVEGIGLVGIIPGPATNNMLARIDPSTMAVTPIGVMTGYLNIAGLASIGGELWAFSELGEILSVNVSTGTATLVITDETSDTWSGAAAPLPSAGG
jgi:outer membrane protein assembly factor BamB